MTFSLEREDENPGKETSGGIRNGISTAPSSFLINGSRSSPPSNP